MDPDDKVLLEGTGDRQGDYIFTANKVWPLIVFVPWIDRAEVDGTGVKRDELLLIG